MNKVSFSTENSQWYFHIALDRTERIFTYIWKHFANKQRNVCTRVIVYTWYSSRCGMMSVNYIWILPERNYCQSNKNAENLDTFLGVILMAMLQQLFYAALDRFKSKTRKLTELCNTSFCGCFSKCSSDKLEWYSISCEYNTKPGNWGEYQTQS